MHVFKVDDGAWHWVIAKDRDDALQVWRDAMVEQHGLSDEDLDEAPGVTQLDIYQAQKTRIWTDEPGVFTTTARQELERDGTRRYLGCSEW